MNFDLAILEEELVFSRFGRLGRVVVVRMCANDRLSQLEMLLNEFHFTEGDR